MAKRQVKVSKDDLGKYMVSGELLNFIMKNDSVFLAKALSVESASVKIKNTKGHVLHLPLDQIEDVWAEEKVAQ